jgi:hypothetical protein
VAFQLLVTLVVFLGSAVVMMFQKDKFAAAASGHFV